MIEYFSVFFQLFFFLIFFSFPFNNKYFFSKFNYYENLTFNIIFNFFILLILSFFKFDLRIFFLSIFSFGVITFFYKFKFYYSLKNINGNKNLFFIFFIFILLNISLFMNVAANNKLEWDGLAHWIFKVQVFYQGGNFANIKEVPFDYYPHLGSYIWAFFWKNSLMQNEYLGRLIFPFLYLMAIFFSISSFFKNSSFIYIVFCLFLFVQLSLDTYLFGGYQDYLIFFELAVFSKLFFLYQNKRNYFFLFILIFINSLLILWTKQEGFFYFIIILFIFLLYSKNKNINILFFLLSIFCIIMQIYLKKIFIGTFSFNEPIFHEGLKKYLHFNEIYKVFFIITKNVVVSFFKYPIWILIIILSLFSFFNKIIVEKYVIMFFLLFLIFVYAVYFQTSMKLETLLPVTIHRLFLQASGFFIFPCMIILQKIFSKYLKNF